MVERITFDGHEFIVSDAVMWNAIFACLDLPDRINAGDVFPSSLVNKILGNLGLPLAVECERAAPHLELILQALRTKHPERYTVMLDAVYPLATLE